MKKDKPNGRQAMDRRAFLQVAAGSAILTIPGCGQSDAVPTAGNRARFGASPNGASVPAAGAAGSRTALPVNAGAGASTLGTAGAAGTRIPGSGEAGTAGTAGAAGMTSRVTQAKNKPNVLFIFDDQLRADVCGIYGGRNITTPNIDRLAREGVIFTNSVSSCPLCTPYRGMLQTGRYATHSGMIMNFVEANHVQNPNCMADVFRAAGYATGFIGKWHLSSGWRHEEGLYQPNGSAVQAYQAKNPETEYVAPGAGRLGFEHWQAYNFHCDFNNYFHYENSPERIYSGRFETDTQIDQAIAYMEKCRQEHQPFFLSVAPHPPHPPFNTGSIPTGYLAQVPETLWWSPNVPVDNPRSELEMRCYLAMSKNMDDNLGRLLDYLATTGLAENTVVVFTSDHGEMHGSHGRLNKMVPYAEAINIPLIMRWPERIAANSRIDTVQAPIDHLPTLCGLLGLPIPHEVDGSDLSPLLLGTGVVDRDHVLIANYTSDWDFLQTGTSWPEWRGIRTKQYTYCQWLTGGEELYDNLEDPYQMQDLVASRSQAQTLKDLRMKLAELLAVAHDDFRSGPDYGEWYDDRRNLIRTGLGPVPT